MAGVGKSASKLIHMVVGRFLLLSGCWPEASVPHYVGLSIGQFTAWQLFFSPRMSDPIGTKYTRWKPQFLVFFNLISEMTYQQFYCMLLVT